METQAKASLKKSITKCAYSSSGCSDRAVKIIGDCRYCNQKFCGKHRLPEAHGCSNMDSCREIAAGRNAEKLMGERCVSEKV
jgi:predicted nucleic acid binding AN1-type Zn finger protein